jgi:heat shock protein HtpX
MAVETFQTLIARNKRNSWILILCFLVVFLALGTVIGLVWGGYSEPQTDVFGEPVAGSGGGYNWPFALATAGVAAGIAFIISLATYYRGGDVLMAISGAREIQKADDPQLWNVVEEMAIAGGLPMPRIYLINDSAMNAFATGRDPKHASVAITTGLRQKLTRDELQSVMAHELSHVRHYDILYATLMAVMVGFMVILSDIFLRSLWFGAGSRRRRSRDSGGGGAQLVLLVIAIAFAILAPILAKIIQMALSRQREFLADAGSVELTRNPDGMSSALARLSGDTEVLEAANRATAPLYIVNPVMKARSDGRSVSLFDTHPPLAERIQHIQNLSV